MTVGPRAALLATALLLTGCLGQRAAERPGEVELTVLAAASLRDAVSRAGNAYQVAHPGTRLVISTDSSAALATQIERGAPADLFLSADRSNVERLAGAGLTAGEPVIFAGNDLTVIVPSGKAVRVETPADLARPGIAVIAAGDQVPISVYAADLIGKLALEPGYPADFPARYQQNIVSREDNVRAVVTKVELGEGDAGIVYATDAAASNAVDVVPIPDGANVRVDYVGTIVATSPHQAAAAAFLEWLAGPEGQMVLGGFGFVAPAP